MIIEKGKMNYEQGTRSDKQRILNNEQGTRDIDQWKNDKWTMNNEQ